MNYPNLKETQLTMRKEAFYLFLIVAFNLIIKAIPAGILELGNDEVYYWTYALFPDWSHFDHPPMVGMLIQLFSFNLAFQSELILRAGALLLSSANIIILFYLVQRLFTRKAAYIAVLMYISSFYFNIISGLFILPDAPQVFFVLLALRFLLPSLTLKDPQFKDNIRIIIFGVLTGLAFLSKYHSLFLWFGASLYILFHNRIWLKKPALYLAMLGTLIISIPVLYWNFKNDFISFTFHSNRVGLFHSPVNFTSFIQFNLGQFFYQNPVLSVIYLISLYNVCRKNRGEVTEINLLLLYLGIPLIAVFVLFSLFHSTLPHWSGPAFICLIILSSEYLEKNYQKRKKLISRALMSAIGILVLVLVLGTLQINRGIFDTKRESATLYPGKNDFTLDMFGWKQARDKFDEFLVKEGIPESDHNGIAIVSNNWFPAAHLDYYIAHPDKIKLIALGDIERIHKYFWINRTRRLSPRDRIFYVTDSRNYNGPEEYTGCFSRIIPLDTLIIKRNQKTVKYIYIYDMVDFRCDTLLNSIHPGF